VQGEKSPCVIPRGRPSLPRFLTHFQAAGRAEIALIKVRQVRFYPPAQTLRGRSLTDLIEFIQILIKHYLTVAVFGL
jgi:hypothetical protein